MDDKRLEYLLKLAAEAEDLERSAAEPPLRLVPAQASSRAWLLPLAGMMAAAAALVAVITVVVPALSPVGPGSMATRGHRPPTRDIVPSDFERPLGATSPDEGSVVLAIFEGFDGRCTCVQVQDQDWDSEQLGAKGVNELVQAVYNSSSRCATVTPRIDFIGVAYKRGDLEAASERVEEVAAVAFDDRTSGADRIDRISRALTALPGVTQVVPHSFGNRNPILEHAKVAMR